MFCPECNAEYKPGFTRCCDCDVELVELMDRVSPPTSGRGEESVVVATTKRPLEEGQICSFLEANGIPVQVRGGSFLREYALNVGGGVQILVPEDFADAAADLLQKADRGDLKIGPKAD